MSGTRFISRGMDDNGDVANFNETEYGFSEFAELLNLAQDKGLVRAEAGIDHHLRFYQGDELLSILEGEDQSLSSDPQPLSSSTEVSE